MINRYEKAFCSVVDYSDHAGLRGRRAGCAD